MSILICPAADTWLAKPTVSPSAYRIVTEPVTASCGSHQVYTPTCIVYADGDVCTPTDLNADDATPTVTVGV